MNEIKDTLNMNEHHTNKLPTGINVLTILTFVGSAWGFLGLIINLFQDCEKALEQFENMPEMGGILGKLMNSGLASIEILCENKILIVGAGLVGVALCVIGAVLMRKLKKQGLVLYLIGEFLPPVIMMILGFSTIPVIAATGFIIPVIFGGLYLAHSKYLVN